jgi:tRNA pseudouridine38-40 synthase
VRGTNANLHRGARVIWATPVPADFHARYSARARTYRYLLLDAPVAPAILRGRVGWHHRPLNVELMHRAAQDLVGEHDFSAFRDAECQAKSPVRTLARSAFAVAVPWSISPSRPTRSCTTWSATWWAPGLRG